MEIIKNLEILDNTSEGFGLGKNENVIIFVKNALIGDIVDVKITQKKKNFYNGVVERYIKKSDFRKNLFDNKFTDVYPFIDLNYEKEIEIKKNIILNNLRKNAKIFLDDIEIVENKNEFNYRNKIELKTNENFELCYCVDSGENKIALKKCPLTDNNINEFLPFLQEKLKLFKIKPYDFRNDSGILKNISIKANFNGELILTLVVKEISDKLINFVKTLEERENLIQGYININPKNKSLIMGEKTYTVFKKFEFYDNIGVYKFNISPKSFFQVNKYQTEKLYNIAKEFLGENKEKSLLDLYSGIGTTTIYFAENFKNVIGVEVVKDSIKDAKENAKLNNIENVYFIYGKSEEKIEEILKQNNIDIISVDPPRKGLDSKVIETIIKSNVKKLVYISCNSSTLARDIKLLSKGGYELKKIKATDMFSKTPHVETIVLLSRK